MRDYILLMHNDATEPTGAEMWEAYFARLEQSGAFQGGSAIGAGGTFRKSGTPGPLGVHIGGYIRIEAEDVAAAKAWLDGNPIYECGGTVEIRELPRDD